MTGMLLTTDRFCVSYGQVQVLHDIAIAVPKGALVAVIGANGAGKTTLVNALIGLNPSRGAVTFAAEPIAAQPLEQRIRRGLGLVPERRELFADMTVQDNLLLGGFRRSRADRRDDLEAVLQRFPRLRERHRQLAGTLSGGERQMLAMGRALMGRPKLLMLDEPSLGLAPRIIRDVFDILTGLLEAGVSILLIEQNARSALKIADYAYVMELGRISAEGTPARIAEDERLVESYLGFGKNAY